MNGYGFSPDLVLIDGRFRVACLLTALLKAKAGTVILFDDYLNRRELYGRVEDLLLMRKQIGRMAEFVVPDVLDRGLCGTIRREFLFDPR